MRVLAAATASWRRSLPALIEPDSATAITTRSVSRSSR
jgi:hypothetical protein